MANAAFMSTSLGGGNHEHLALVVSGAMYRQIARQDFPPPANSGPTLRLIYYKKIIGLKASSTPSTPTLIK
eukprot:7380725-Ditylum_brightwellii.AAC.2